MVPTDTEILDFVFEQMRLYSGIHVYPCHAEDGHGYFACDLGHGHRFTGDSPRAAVVAAMSQYPQRNYADAK